MSYEIYTPYSGDDGILLYIDWNMALHWLLDKGIRY